MSRVVVTPPPAQDSGDLLDDLDSDVAISPSDVLERLWRFFIAMRTGLFLILALGLLSLAGTVLVQAPSGLRGDPQAYASWLDAQRQRYGGWTTVLDKLGLFSVFSSLWFKAIVVLLATSILACSVNRAPRLWHRAVHPRRRMSESFFKHAPLRAGMAAPTDPVATLENVRKVLRGKHFRTIPEPSGEVLNLYADRCRWAPFGTILTHVGFVVILIGAFLSATTGFKDTQVAVPVGSKVAIGHGTALSVEAKSFSDSYYPDGSPKDYASELVIFRNGVAVRTQTVRVNHPLRWDGVSFFQSFFGVAAAMRVSDAAGRTVFDAGVPLMWRSDDGKHSIGQFAMTGRGLTVYVVSAASGEVDPNIKAGQVQLEVYGSSADSPIATQVVSQGKPATIAGLSFTFERTRQFTGLIVSRDPGAVFVWVGSTLLALGIVLVLLFPHRRVWVRVRRTPSGSEILCATTRRASARRDTATESCFQQLVNDIQLAVTRSSTQRR